ncbi:MAG: hypothetical protein Q7R45_02105, partial [Sulfuricaulis sp.]|nr:hypothetical protein [Sulfuricaulis sp.]
LGAGMATADDDDIEMLGIKHGCDLKRGESEWTHTLASNELQRPILPGRPNTGLAPAINATAGAGAIHAASIAPVKPAPAVGDIFPWRRNLPVGTSSLLAPSEYP